MMFTLPSGVIRMKTLGANAVCSSPKVSAARPNTSICDEKRTPPLASADAWRNWRRLTRRVVVIVYASLARPAGTSGRIGLCKCCPAMNCGTDSIVRRATTDIPLHCRVDIGIGRLRRPGKQSCGAHYLSRLTISALRNIDFLPRALQRMISIRRQTFNGSDTRAGNRGYRPVAGSYSGAILMYGACTALTQTAAEFRTFQVESVPENPKQRRVRRNVHGCGFSIQSESDWHVYPLPGCARMIQKLCCPVPRNTPS